MNADRWQKLKSILAEALEHESPSTRSAVISHSCANDVDLSPLVKFERPLGPICAAAFSSLPSNRVISQRFAHNPCEDRKKIGAIAPHGSLTLISEA